MVVFDNWKFREILKSIVEKKELNGDRISSKQQLYVRIQGDISYIIRDYEKVAGMIDFCTQVNQGMKGKKLKQSR